MSLLLTIALLCLLSGAGLCCFSVTFNTRHKLVFLGSALLGLSFWLLLAWWAWVFLLW